MAKVFKFGGASVKDAQAVRNLAEIVQTYSDDSLIVIVSAMGKTTNALETLLKAATSNATNFGQLMAGLRQYHYQITSELFGTEHIEVDSALEQLFDALEEKASTKHTDKSFDWLYDQVVSFGELISTLIVSAWLKHIGLNCQLLDARDYVITDGQHRAANIDWETSEKNILGLKNKTTVGGIFLTQGFIGRSKDGSTTTLGREGSDFSAAIFAHCLDASELTIWKDVPGLLNADPKRMENTIKLDQISYSEAIELAFYGATIIHPKTIKPLQNKNIPLYIKSFLKPELTPSVISSANDADSQLPSYIFKDNQLLVSIGSRDFSFMDEGRLQTIFGELHRMHIHTNLVQTSALSLSICVDDREGLAEKLIKKLGSDFYLKYNPGLTLLTVRHYDETKIGMLIQGKKIFLEQRSRTTLQFVMGGTIEKPVIR